MESEKYLYPPKCCWHFHPSYNRFIAFIFILLVVFFYGVIYDMIGPLESVFKETFSVAIFEFGYLNSVYALPNIVCCFLNGILIDKILGLRLGIIIFAFLVFLGQLIFTVGTFFKLYWVVLFGRFTFGMGNASLLISITCYLTLWFKNHEINLAYSLYSCTIRLASSSVFVFTLPLYAHFKDLSPDYSLGLTSSVFAFFAFLQILFVYFISYYSIINNKLYQPDFDNSFCLWQIVKLPVAYWLIAVPLALSSSSLNSFVFLSQPFLEHKYHINSFEANNYCSFFNLVGGFGPLLPGVLADMTGRNLFYTLSGFVLGLLSFSIFLFTSSSPFLPLTLLAVGFAFINTCSWTLLSLSVKYYQLATGVAFVLWMCNILGLIFPTFVAFLLQTYGSNGLSLFFFCCYLIGFICNLIAIYIDKRSDGILNISAKERKGM